MDLEEQSLNIRSICGKKRSRQKINLLKGRLEDLKHLSDVKSKVEERPVLTFAGSVVAGLIAGKWINKKKPALRRWPPRGSSRNASLSANAAGGLPGSGYRDTLGNRYPSRCWNCQRTSKKGDAAQTRETAERPKPQPHLVSDLFRKLARSA